MNGLTAVESSSLKATQALGCANFKSQVFDSMYDYLDNQKDSPNLDEFTLNLNKQIDTLAKIQNIQDTKNIENIKIELSALYKTLIEKSKNLKQVTTARKHLETIIELEMQDISTAENILLNNELGKQFAQVMATAKSLEVQCSQNSEQNEPDPATPPTRPPTNSYPDNSQPSSVSKIRVLAGSHNVIATAYQSCQSLEIPEVSASTSNIMGITRLSQNHPDGIGGKRIISDLKQVQNTHPYIKVAGGSQQGCFNVRNNPLIYDYGGEPSVSNNTINFFKDSGTGTSVLGVDCSAYISAAVANAGLKYNPSVENKPIFIRQNSSKFINAKKSGFKCFQNITMTPTSSIKPGDIVAVRGHVVMIDTINSDPFGLKKLKSASECGSIKIDQFDFTISQSSPNKNGIGINKFIAKDYLKEEGPGKMQTAFLGLAKSACESYFKQINIASPSTEYGAIRHLGSPECLSNTIPLANQSCVSQCLQ